MPTATIRISQSAHETLRTLARQRQVPMTNVLQEAIEKFRRDDILEQTNAAYAALRADPQAWQDLEEERAAWDATLSDGIEPQ